MSPAAPLTRTLTHPPLPSPAPSPTRPSPHPRPHGSQRWRAMSRTACRCAPGLPGNASSSWRVPHIQTHQPSLMDRLQVRVRWCGLARLVRPSPLTPRHTYTHAPPSNTHTHIHTYTYTHTHSRRACRSPRGNAWTLRRCRRCPAPPATSPTTRPGPRWLVSAHPHRFLLHPYSPGLAPHPQLRPPAPHRAERRPPGAWGSGWPARKCSLAAPRPSHPGTPTRQAVRSAPARGEMLPPPAASLPLRTIVATARGAAGV